MSDPQPDLFAFHANHRELISPAAPRNPPIAAAALDDAALIAAIGVLASVIVAGCSALPTAGPTASDVKGQEVKDNLTRFDLVSIDDNVVTTLLALPAESFHVRFKKYGRPPQPKIGIGDSIVVSIWEAAGGG